MPLFISYNIHALTGPNSLRSLISSLFKSDFKYMDRLVDLIGETAPAVVGLNEMPLHGKVAPLKEAGAKNCLELLLEQLEESYGNSWKHEYKALLDNKQGIYGNALLVETGKAAWVEGIEAVTGIYLTLAQKRMDKYLGVIERSYVIRVVKFQGYKTPIVVALTHFEDWPLKATVRVRWAQAAELVKIVDRVRSKHGGIPAVIMGDLNAAPPSFFYNIVPRNIPTWMQKNEDPTKNGDGRNTIKVFIDGGYSPVFAPGDFPPTYPALNPIVPIDHILVSEGVKVKKAKVIDTNVTRSISDHLPVVAELEWPA